MEGASFGRVDWLVDQLMSRFRGILSRTRLFKNVYLDISGVVMLVVGVGLSGSAILYTLQKWY